MSRKVVTEATGTTKMLSCEHARWNLTDSHDSRMAGAQNLLGTNERRLEKLQCQESCPSGMDKEAHCPIL